MRDNPRNGFTLVELLVVIGIIALLIAILLPTLSKARKSALRTRTLAGLREVLMGYTQYHMDNRGCLLLGYPPAVVNGVPVTATDPNTKATYTSIVADRYPWRLAPYVRHVWKILHIHTEVPDVPMPTDPRSPPSSFTPDTADYKAYILSLQPAFGINSVFLGGHQGPIFQGFIGDQPNIRKHVAFQVSEIKRPSETIVFTEVQQAMMGFAVPVNGPGFHYAMPPRASGSRWTVQDGQPIPTSALITGLPKGRYSPKVSVGFFDGHVDVLSPTELQDMRLWSPKATSKDWDF